MRPGRGLRVFVIVRLVVAAGNDLFLRNELGFLAGSALAALLMAVLLWQQMRTGARSLEDLVEVVEHEPLEL